MKKINLRGISEILSEKELKNVMGGSDGGFTLRCASFSCGGPCFLNGHQGSCFYYDLINWDCVCWL